jgi:putative nucleotidyltransferase with HDIG domain
MFGRQWRKEARGTRVMLKRNLVVFARFIRLLSFLYLVIQYIQVRDRYDKAVIPVVAGLGVFYLFMDWAIYRVPPRRFRFISYLLMVTELALLSLLVYFTRSSPIFEIDILFILPIVNIALWFGIREGLAFGGLTSLAFTSVALVSGRINGQAFPGLLGRYILYISASMILGYMSDVADRETEEKAKRLVELTALSSFATLFDSSMAEELVMRNLGDALARSLEPDVCMVFGYIPEEGRLELVYSHGLLPFESEMAVPSDYGLMARVVHEGETVLVTDTDREPDYRQLIRSRRLRSAMYSPLRWRDDVYGVALVGSERREAFGYIEKEFMTSLCIQAALAIHNSRLYADLEDRIGELHAIFEIDKAITSAVDLELVLQEIVHMSVGLMNARVSSIILLDEESGSLKVAAAHGLPPEYLESGPFGIEGSLAGRVVREGRPIALEAVDDDTRGKYADLPEMAGLASVLAVPLNLKDRIIGVLQVYTGERHRFTPHEVNLFTSLASQAAIAIENARLFRSLEEIYIGVITALASAIDARDPYTHGHSARVTEFSVRIAENMGLSEEEKDIIRYASLLHDIGKIGIKERILKKPDKLTEEERREMETHPLIAARILQSVTMLEPVMNLVMHHHERYDGKGYPSGLAGEEIPLGARIIAVADAFESMISDRPYRKALPLEEAVAELRRGRGTQFDPRVVDIFLGMLERGEVGLGKDEVGKIIYLEDFYGDGMARST